MGHTGAELGADCADLWAAGHFELKPLGAVFREAARNLHLADCGLPNMYRDSRLDGPYGPVRDAWCDFRDDVFAVLRETAESLDLTGDALILAANEYLRADQAAKDEFDRLRPAILAAHPGEGRPR